MTRRCLRFPSAPPRRAQRARIVRLRRATRGTVSAIALKRALAVAEEAAFLWVSRNAVARSSAVTFDALARLDERLSRRVYKLSERPVLAERFLQHDNVSFTSGLAFVTAVVALRGGAVGIFD